MHIIPIRDLKNTVEIEKKCAESNEPVFVTKNGYGCLVVMNIECYDRIMGELEEARAVNHGIDDYENGRIVPGKSVLQKARKKHEG